MKKIIENVIFFSRWILIPFYLVLILVLCVYTYFDVHEFIEYVSNIQHVTKEVAMLTFIEMIDMTMIANLGKMIITGSYNSFVDKEHGYKNDNISSGLLKVKMATSLVGVTGIALLQRSIDVDAVSWDTLYKLGFVHGIFLISSLVLEVVEYMHVKSEKIEHKLETQHTKH